MLRRIVVAGVAIAVLGLLPVAAAHAGNRAAGGFTAKTSGSPKYLGEFDFDPSGNRVSVFDSNPDNWDVIVELVGLTSPASS